VTCEDLKLAALPQDVADALGWDLIELRTQVGRWATLLLAEGRLSDADYTNLMNSVFGPATW
jgi:hypothetical protein